MSQESGEEGVTDSGALAGGAAEMSGGEMSGGETSGGETSGGEMSGGEMSGGEMSGGEMSGGEMSAAARLDAEFEAHRQRLTAAVAAEMDERLRARVDPSDIAQEALLDAAQQVAQGKVSRRENLFAWLLHIAKNRLKDAHRRNILAQRRSIDREQAVESARGLSWLAGGGTDPADAVVRGELWARLRTLVSELPEHDRQLLYLRYQQQRSLAEIAQLLGISENAAKLRHIRALRRLRKLLEDQDREL